MIGTRDSSNAEWSGRARLLHSWAAPTNRLEDMWASIEDLSTTDGILGHQVIREVTHHSWHRRKLEVFEPNVENMDNRVHGRRYGSS